jgi:hypothetical protein
MEKNSVKDSSNAGANLRKEDIHQMIEWHMSEEVQKHFFGFSFSKEANSQLSAFYFQATFFGSSTF